jgi:glutaredoxin-like protein NrdH
MLCERKIGERQGRGIGADRNRTLTSTGKEGRMAENNIKLYALTTCIHCRNTKEYLDKCGLEYQCVHVDQLSGDERKAVLEEVKKLNPDCSFPTILIGDKVIVGFRKDQIEEALQS